METFSSLVDKLLVHPSLCDYIVQFSNISELFSSRFMNLYWLCNILEGAYVRYSGEEAEPFEYSRDNWRENLPRLIKLVHLCELNEIKSDEKLTCMLETADSPTAILYFCDLLSGILDIVDDRVVTMFPPKPHRVGASGAMNFFTSSSAQRTSTRPLEQLNIASSPRQQGMSNTSTSARVALVPFGSPKPSAHPIFSPGAMVYNTAINLIQTFIPTAGTTARSEPDSDEKNQEMVSFEERELQFEREKRSVMVVASSQSLAAAEAREDLMRVISELDDQKKANADLQVKISSLEAALSLTDKANDVIQTNEIVARDSINIDQENAVKALESEKATTLSLQATLEDFQKKLTAREEELQKAIFLEKQRADIAIRSTGVELVSVKSDLLSLRSLVSNQVTMATKGLAELSSSLAFRLADAERGVTEAKSRYLSEQIERRKVLNALQEAKGSIRVLARVRPLLNHERALEGVNDPSNVIRASSSFELIVPEAEAINARARFQESKSFEFERVFSAGSTQADVFAEVQPLVQSALDGYHACIFAYGQTGSGKTHTMEGGDTDETRGVYYRSLNELFNERDRRSVEWEFTMRLSIVEIYNETVVDLLADAPSSVSDDVSMDGEGSRAFVEIKQGPQGVHLPDAVVVEVSSQEAVEALMKRGSSNRSVGRTNANEHSSRSHSLLILDIHGSSRLGTGEQTYGRLVLVDLAGSERLSKSGAEGMRLKEAQAINSSLSALGDVISAMAKKASHIPFRNSKLTYLLQDSLGKGRTMMIANLSPTPASRGETLCTLTFASRVRKVEVGKAIKHADSGELKRAKEAAAKAAEEADAVAEKAAVMSEKVNELTSKLTTVESELATLKKSLLVTSNSTTTSSTQMSTVAAGSSADVIAAAVKRATEDVTAKMKLAQAEAVRRAAFDAEATAKAEAEKSKLGLQRQLRELQTALERADVKSKDAIAAAVQAARVSWERERERDRARTTRSGKVTEKGGPPSRKQSLSGTWLASTIAAAGINSTGSASSSHEAGKTTSSTTALISAATASMVDERAITIPSAAALFMEGEDEYVDRIIADDDLGNEDTLNDVAENLDDIAIPDGGHVAGPSVSIAEADVSAVNISVTSTTINDSTLIAEEDLNEKSVVVTNPLAPFCEDGNQRLMVVSPLPSTSLSGQKTQTPVSSDAISLSITSVASAQDSVGCSSTLSSSPPSLPLQPAQTKSLTPFKATLSSRAPTPDENEEDEPVEANIANASDVLTSAVPSTLQESTEVNGEVSATGKFTFGSRERARLAGLPSPKPESGILKQGAAGGKRRRSNPDNSTTALSDQAVSGATSVIAIGRPTRGKKTVALLSPDMSSAVRITAPQILDVILPTSIPQSAAPISATVTSHVSTKKPTSLSRSSSGSSLHQSSQSISQTNRSSTPAASRKPSLQITQPPTTTTTVGPAPSLLVAAPSTVVAPLHAASPRAPLQPRPANVVSSTASLAGAKRSAPGPAPSDIDALKKPRKEGGASSSSTSSGPSRVKVDAQSSKPAQKGATRVVVNALGQVARRA